METHNKMTNVLGNAAPSKTIIVRMWVFEFKPGHTKDDPCSGTPKVQQLRMHKGF